MASRKRTGSTRPTPRGVTREAVELMIRDHMAEVEQRISGVAEEQRALTERQIGTTKDVQALVDAINGGARGAGLDKTVFAQEAVLDRIEEGMRRVSAEVLGQNGEPSIREVLRFHDRRWSLASRFLWLAITTIAGAVASLAVKVLA